MYIQVLNHYNKFMEKLDTLGDKFFKDLLQRLANFATNK